MAISKQKEFKPKLNMGTIENFPLKIAVRKKTNAVYTVDPSTDKIDLDNAIEWPANSKAYKKYGENNFFTIYTLKKAYHSKQKGSAMNS